MNFPGIFFLALVSIASAQVDTSALGALKLLPKDVAKRLARIEARDVAGVPERWHFIVHDPALPRGMREFVVARGKIAASRDLSQFVESVSATDVIGGDAVKVDSDRITRLAALFAAANGGRVGSLNFELARDAASNAPVWRATVLNPDGDQLGVLAVNALKGALLSHDGFEIEPSAELLSSVQLSQAAAIQNPPPGLKGGQAQPPAARVVRPTPTPKANIFKRIFRSDEARGTKPGQ